VHRGWYDRRVRRVRDLSAGDTRIYLEVEVRRVRCRSCGTVKREQLAFLADNPAYTKRFAFYVGRRCRQAPIKDIALELGLDWDTVKSLEMQYMRAQLAKAGTPALSRRENLTLEGRRALKTLLAANKRLNTAYVLKESFGQLWDYEREGWARRFFDNWRASLKWQRLEPYAKFARMVDRH
jgi:transposase